jgi:chaperonin cofactor prefoldin
LTNLADTVDTEQAIKLTEKLQNTLLQKKKYEQYLKQANEAQKILNEIKQNINKDKWR